MRSLTGRFPSRQQSRPPASAWSSADPSCDGAEPPLGNTGLCWAKRLTNCQQHLHTSTHTHRFTWDYMCIKSRDWGTAAVSFQTTPPVYIKQQKWASSLLTARGPHLQLFQTTANHRNPQHAQRNVERESGNLTSRFLPLGKPLWFSSPLQMIACDWTAFEGHISVEPLMCAWLHSVHFNPFLNCLANYIAYCLLHNASFLNANKISKSLKPDLQEQFGKRGKFLIFINQKPTYSYLSSSKIFDEE